MSEKQPARGPVPEPEKGATKRDPAGDGKRPPSGGAEFDFAIEEIAPNERLKEGFTGQER